MSNRTCPDCDVCPGTLHEPGCDVEHCPRCGGQTISCNCIYEFCGLDVSELEEQHPDIYKNGPTDAMYERWDAEWGAKRMPWTGEWPGVVECRELGWYAVLVAGQGWVPCSPDTPGASEDLNRLVMKCVWDRRRQKYVLPVQDSVGEN